LEGSGALNCAGHARLVAQHPIDILLLRNDIASATPQAG
jgi:hypothetical protein